ncbi:MAG: type VI secretion system protein TssA, partial [Alphaproteobacteria bacterium]
MVSGTPPDLASLLAPTHEQPPNGRSVRYEGDHDRIRAARRADGAHRPRGVWQRELKRADWNAVIEEAAATLTQRSKDLQVAAWLVEALVERDGFGALAPGLDFLDALLDRYWDGLFPALDDDGDVEARLAPLFWLDGRLAVVARQQPLTRPEQEPSLSYTDYANARRLERIRIHDPAAAAASEERGAVTLAAFEEAIGRTPQPALHAVADELEAAEAALARLVATADGLAGARAPSMHELGGALGEVRALVAAALRPAPTSPAPAPNRRAPRPPR